MDPLVGSKGALVSPMEIRVVRRRALEFLLGFSATAAPLWLFIESLSVLLPRLAPRGLVWYVAFLILSAFGGLWRSWPKKRIEFPIPLSDSRFEIARGDLFASDAVAVIPVNEYFDGELGDHVSEDSVHGKFISRVLGGQTRSFFDLTSKALAMTEPAEVGVGRRSGQSTRYEIGTVARLDVSNRRYLLAALTHTDLDSLAGSATVQDLWACLEGIWKAVREHSNGRPAVMPLLGSGQSKIGLPAAHLIEIILISFAYNTKKSKITNKVTLLLQPDRLREVDLRTIKRSWT